MQQSKQEVQYYQEDEIDLKALAYSLIERKFLILGLTAFITVLAALYTATFTPNYQAKVSIVSAPSSSLVQINNLIYTSETKKSIFSEFLTQLSSKELQKIAFVEGDFLTLFNPDNSPIDDVDAFISSTLESVRVNSPSITSKQMGLGFLTELPYSVSMEGGSAETISEYLNTLVTQANSKTIIGIIKHTELMISNRLEEIFLERDLLIKQAEKDRFSQIERIKEEDAQKIRQINDQIERARYKAKEDRLNQIVVLIDAAKLAKSLGIIENNFKLVNDDGAKSDLTIAIGESKDLPEWYLYGEKALIQRVELLENRMSDDPFIPELVTLNNQLNEVQNNNLLKTLETRQDDSPFIPELVALNLEVNQLKSTNLNIASSKSINLSSSEVETSSRNKNLTVLLAFFVGLMLSILLALIMSALKPDEEASV